MGSVELRLCYYDGRRDVCLFVDGLWRGNLRSTQGQSASAWNPNNKALEPENWGATLAGRLNIPFINEVAVIDAQVAAESARLQGEIDEQAQVA